MHPRPFNAHSPGAGGSGLVQYVFRSPARNPARQSSRRGLCAAPLSEKRSSLCYAMLGPPEFISAGHCDLNATSPNRTGVAFNTHREIASDEVPKGRLGKVVVAIFIQNAADPAR